MRRVRQLLAIRIEVEVFLGDFGIFAIRPDCGDGRIELFKPGLSSLRSPPPMPDPRIAGSSVTLPMSSQQSLPKSVFRNSVNGMESPKT